MRDTSGSLVSADPQFVYYDGSTGEDRTRDVVASYSQTAARRSALVVKMVVAVPRMLVSGMFMKKPRVLRSPVLRADRVPTPLLQLAVNVALLVKDTTGCRIALG